MSDHGKRRPAPVTRGFKGWETQEFANRRKKSRKRNELAKSSRRKNR
jgi:hypothetical protein